MADQCIVCLEALDIETVDANATPPPPAELQLLKDLKDRHERLAIEDPETLEKTNQKNESLPINNDHVAQISGCGHMLHDACLREWSDKANSCPICRQTFNVVTVYEKVGGKYLATRPVEDKKQRMPEFDPRDLDVEIEEQPEALSGNPCPYCDSAANEDVLLLCDGCDIGYHTHCIGLDSIPGGPWLCHECRMEYDREPAPRPRRGSSTSRGNYYFPRTQATMRRAWQLARADEWQGAWGQITGRVFNALDLDLDYYDDDDSALFEGLRRSRLTREREEREHQRWQQRLNIASRLGARDVFASNIREFVTAPPTPVETREQQLAWGTLEKARDMESRKRKSRSATAEQHEEPPPEAERKHKRPRTRRVPRQNSESSSAAREPGPSNRQDQGGPPPNGAEAQPSFLASLLKEVESSVHPDNLPEAIYSSPGRSTSPHSNGSITPPLRSSSPVTPMTSYCGPVFTASSLIYSPTAQVPSSSIERPTSPAWEPTPREGQSSPETSGSEDRGRSQGRRLDHGPLQIRHLKPQTKGFSAQFPRTVSKFSSRRFSRRPTLPLDMKENISRIVRSALKPHWRSKEISEEQFTSINRDISHKIYEEVRDPAAVDEDIKKGWEKIAAQEVERAIAALKPEAD